MGLTVALVRVALAVVFVAAAAGKLLDLAGSRTAARDFGVPPRLAGLVGTALPAAELLIGIALIPTPSARWGGLAALVLLAAFIAGIARLMRRGEAPECHCFGQLQSEPAGRSTLIRNALLAAGAVVVVTAGPGRSLSSFTGEDAALTIVSVAALALAAYAYSLARRTPEPAQGPRRRPSAPVGLPVGTPAPDVALRTLDGEQLSLRSLIADGTPSLLVHVSPDCGPCRSLAPDLGRWRETIDRDLRVWVLSSGELEPSAAFAQEAGLPELFISEPRAFGSAYGVRATPSAVMLDGSGRVAARAVAGTLAIEALIRVALHRAGSNLPDSPLDVVRVPPAPSANTASAAKAPMPQ